jgi:hypothetical protein
MTSKRDEYMRMQKLFYLLALAFLLGCGGEGVPAQENEPPAPADGVVEQSAPLVKETEMVEARGTAVATLAPVAPESTPVLEENETIVVTPAGKETPVGGPENGVSDMKTATDVRQALSEQLGLSVEAVAIVEEAEVTWSDGSLGCPQPGINYLQVLTPGRQLILQADGDLYHYHAGATGDFKFCADPQPPVQNPGSGLGPNQTPPEGVND